MIKVWILVALVNSGHLVHSVVPTLEFKTKEACEVANGTFKTEAEKRNFGTFKGYCVEIQK